jgi:hypothetical protein
MSSTEGGKTGKEKGTNNTEKKEKRVRKEKTFGVIPIHDEKGKCPEWEIFEWDNEGAEKSSDTENEENAVARALKKEKQEKKA